MEGNKFIERVFLFFSNTLEIVFKNKKTRDRIFSLFSYLYHSFFNKIVCKKTLPDGNLLFYRPYSIDKNIIDEIYEFQVYDRLYKPQKGCIVFDIGSHIGIFTLKAAKLIGKNGLIFAIEPEPKNYLLLKKNIEVNNLTNVKAINAVIGQKKGQVKLYLSQTNTGGHSTTCSHDKNLLDFSRQEYIEVPMLTLNDLVKKVDLNKGVFIKMDCEGAETEAIKGADKILEKNDVTISSAIYHTPFQKTQLTRILRSKSFKIHTSCARDYIYARKLESNNGINS